MPQIFRIPRWTDREVIEILQSIETELSIPNAKLYFQPFDGVGPSTIAFDRAKDDQMLRILLPYENSSVLVFALAVINTQVLWVRRKGDSLFDEVSMDWQTAARAGIKEDVYARMIGLAKRKFKEVSLNEAFSGFPNDEINKYYEARDASLTRLESMSKELLFAIHERQKQLDVEYAKKTQDLETKFNDERATLQKEFGSKIETLVQKEEAFKKKEADFETKESKYLRRQLRQEMLTRLADLSKKFELTKGTRRLRWPIMGFTILFIAFFGVLTVYAFTQTVQVLNAVGQDLSKLNWWVIGLLSVKQLAYASAFIAGSWFLIKWNDRWFRQHADAEFGYKQLELDINRASWVVEMVMEWKEEKGSEIPAELLDRLTQNLFSQPSHGTSDAESPPDLASVLLGSASTLKLKAGNGTEMQLDRKGIKNAIKES